MTEWPKHPDGLNMAIGEMPPHTAKQLLKEAADRLKAKLEDPNYQARIDEVFKKFR